MDYLENGLDEAEAVKEEAESAKKKRAPFAYWTVGGRDYKLKLSTAVICQLEAKFKANLLSLISNKDLPPLAVMLTIIQGAMKEWEHGIKYEEVQKLFDKYCEEGGSQVELLEEVVLKIYEVSGFF